MGFWSRIFDRPDEARPAALRFVAANRGLIEVIRDEIARYDRSPPADAEERPEWRTPEPWRTTALEVLTDMQVAMERACQRFTRNRLYTIEGYAQSQIHLSKNLDFDTSWAGPEGTARLSHAVRDVVSTAGALLGD